MKYDDFIASKFWEWMGSWSVVLRNPSDIGFDGSRYIGNLLAKTSKMQKQHRKDYLTNEP